MKNKIKHGYNFVRLFIRTARQRWLYLTPKENRAMVDAAKHLDTEAGLKMVAEVREIFAALNEIRLKERRHILEFKFELDLRAVDKLGEEIACDYLAQLAVNKLRGYLTRRQKNLVEKK